MTINNINSNQNNVRVLSLTSDFCSPDPIRGMSRRVVSTLTQPAPRLFGESSTGVDFARFDHQSGEKYCHNSLPEIDKFKSQNLYYIEEVHQSILNPTAWGGNLFQRFCNMFSESSLSLLWQHGSFSTAQQIVGLSNKTFGTSCHPRL